MPDGGKDVVAYRAKDNRREVLIPAEMFTDKSTGKRIPVRSISWSADNDKVLVYTNTRKVWRYDTRGDYWVLIPAGGTFRQLGRGFPKHHSCSQNSHPTAQEWHTSPAIIYM